VCYQGSRGSSSRAKNEEAANRISLARLSSRFSRSSSLEPGRIRRRRRPRVTGVDLGLSAPPRSVSTLIPTRGPIRLTAAVIDRSGPCSRASRTSRYARSRNSSGYFLGPAMTSILRGSEASINPGAVERAPCLRWVRPGARAVPSRAWPGSRRRVPGRRQGRVRRRPVRRRARGVAEVDVERVRGRGIDRVVEVDGGADEREPAGHWSPHPRNSGPRHGGPATRERAGRQVGRLRKTRSGPRTGRSSVAE
jgi:hypothetical protein